MIADLIDDNLDVRLITQNVMAVYSTNNEYTASFIRKLKHSKYYVNNKVVNSSDIISFIKRNYNIYENIFRFAKRNKHIDENAFIEYLAFFSISKVLWLHFYQLDKDTLKLVELLLQLSSDKNIIIIEYTDYCKLKGRLYSLLFHVGLKDKLIIVPFNDVHEAVRNSTCQCYIKSLYNVKILSKFPSEFINKEFNTDEEYYISQRPKIYLKENILLTPSSYHYTWQEIFLIILFSIKLFLIYVFNWSQHISVTDK